MTELAPWRKAKGWSQRELAIQLGLRSKGRIADIENGIVTAPTDLAIKIDRLSLGEVPVRILRPDLADVRVIQPGAGA